jgi:uncharacterized protein
MTLSAGLFLIVILVLSCLAATISKRQHTALAQPYIQTIEYRNLVIDLGNGVKTNAQLTLPAVGNGPYPGVLLIPGSGAVDMNETLAKKAKPFWQISQYLTERGFVVLRYDKRGIGASSTIVNPNVWGNVTINDLIHDAERALNVLRQQHEVDPKRISIVGHSEGTIIAPRVAIDNSTKVKNIVLIGVVAENISKLLYFQVVSTPLRYAEQVLGHNHTGVISIQQIAKDPFARALLHSNSTKLITNTLAREFGDNTINAGYISIDKQLKPFLIKLYENTTAYNLSKCSNFSGCPIWLRSQFSLIPTLSVIGNISKSTGILILNGENDTQTPVQQAFLLQQRLTEVNHPNHTLITYPNLGHVFYPSSQWSTGIGPIEQYVLADIYAWLEAHSGLSHSFATTTSTIGTNTSSLNTNTTSPSSKG